MPLGFARPEQADELTVGLQAAIEARRWIDEIMPLVIDDADPLGTESFATHRLPLEDAPTAYADFQAKRDGAIKILFNPLTDPRSGRRHHHKEILMPTEPMPAPTDEPDRLLATYLNDHLGGSSAGLDLVRRCRRSNKGTELDRSLQLIEDELESDRRALLDVMERFDIKPSRVKQALGSLAELAARVKTNDRVFGYSPLSRVLELEGLSAGIVTKRSLWRSLRAVADQHPVLDPDELDALIGRASSQHDRVIALHDIAAVAAFPGRFS